MPPDESRNLLPESRATSSNTFEGAIIPERGTDLLAPAPREIEIRYLVPPHLFSTIIGSIVPKEITQHYFPKSAMRGLLEHFSVHALVAGADTFSSARVRRTRDAQGERSYEIEFKGPKQKVSGLRISRAEFGIPISREQFKELRALATAGILEKLRYEVDGSICDSDKLVPIIAQIDLVQRAGIPPKRLDQSYVTADVELTEERLVVPFCQGEHTFSFLSDCIDMGRSGKKIRRHLSSTAVARKGLGKKQRAALEKAHQITQRRS